MPAAGYPFRAVSVERSQSAPARCPSRRVAAARRPVRCARRCAFGRARPDAVMGGWGLCRRAGRRGGAHAAHPARAERGLDSHLRAHQSRVVALPDARAWRSHRRPRRSALPARRASTIPAVPDRARRGTRAARIAADETCGSSSVARSELARSTRPRSARSPQPHFMSCTCAGGAIIPELSSQPLPAGYDLREYLDIDEFTAALAAGDLVVARRLRRCSRSPHRSAGNPVPYPHTSADHQSADARWMSEAGAASSCRTQNSALPG